MRWCCWLSPQDQVYAKEAIEEAIPAADGRALSRAIRARGQVDPVFVDALVDLPMILRGVLQDGDVLLTLGAGDIGAAAAKLPEQLREGAS